jgi:hypothetical protein
MGQVLHGSATTTEAIRRAIQHGQESLRALARRYGINQKTVAKWRGRTSLADLPTGPKEARSTVLSAEEEAVIVAFRAGQQLVEYGVRDLRFFTSRHIRSSFASFMPASHGIPDSPWLSRTSRSSGVPILLPQLCRLVLPCVRNLTRLDVSLLRVGSCAASAPPRSSRPRSGRPSRGSRPW